MRTFENFRKVVNESDYILSEAQRYLEILLEKDSEALKQYKASQKSFKKGFGKNIKPTVVQPGLDLYKAGGPFVPDKTTFADTGKKVPNMEPKPQFGKPKNKSKAPDRTGLKKAISDVRASDKRLYDAGVGKKPSLVQQRKYTLAKIKELSRQTTLKDKLYGSTGSTEGSGGANTGTKPQKPTKSAADFTKEINQKNKNRKEFTGNKKTNNVVDLAKKKQQSKLSQAAKNITQQRDDAIVKREKLRSVKGVKDTKAIRSTNRQVKELDKLAKQTQKAASGVGNPNAPVKYNKMTAGADFIKKNRKGPELPNFIKNKTNNKMVTKSATKKPVSFTIKGATGPKNMKDVKLPTFGLGAKKYATKRGADLAFAKSPAGKIVKKVGLKPLKYGTRAVIKRAGIPGAIVGLGLATPLGRRIAKTVLGGVTGGIIGSQAKNKSTAPTFKKDSQGRDKMYTRDVKGFNLSRKSDIKTTSPKYSGLVYPKKT